MNSHVPAGTTANNKVIAPSDTMASIAVPSDEAHDVPDPSAGGVAATTSRAENKHMPNVSHPPEAGAFGAGSAPAAGAAVNSFRSHISFGSNGATNRQDISVSGDVFLHEQSHHGMRYSPYPPFAPISATSTCGATTSSSSSSVSNSAHGKSPTATGYRNATPSFYPTSMSSTISRYHAGSATSLPSRSSKTITPLVGGGTRTYVIDHLGRLTTAGSAQEITPEVDTISPPKSETLSNETCRENDNDDDDNVSVSSLDVSNHTQAVADALTDAGISTVIVSTISQQPKSLFAETNSGICSPGSFGGGGNAASSQPPSGRRDLLAKFNEAEEAAEAACCRPSGSPSLSSSSSLSGTSSSSTSSSGDEEYMVPFEADGHNLKGDMNEERRADTTKWKRRVGGGKGKNGEDKRKKKRRRLA